MRDSFQKITFNFHDLSLWNDAVFVESVDLRWRRGKISCHCVFEFVEHSKICFDMNIDKIKYICCVFRRIFSSFYDSSEWMMTGKNCIRRWWVTCANHTLFYDTSTLKCIKENDWFNFTSKPMIHEIKVKTSFLLVLVKIYPIKCSINSNWIKQNVHCTFFSQASSKITPQKLFSVFPWKSKNHFVYCGEKKGKTFLQ